MIVLSNSTAQTVAVGDTLTFDTEVLHTGCAECHRKGSSSIKMRAANGLYKVYFSGNIGGTADTASVLNIALSGESLAETKMESVPQATGTYNNVSTSTIIKNCCVDYDRITVVNTGTVSVTVDANPVLYVERLA